MIIFKNIILEILKLLITKWATMMSIYRLLDTAFAINMPTSRYITVANLVEAYSTLKLSLQFYWTYFEVYVVFNFLGNHYLVVFYKQSNAHRL